MNHGICLVYPGSHPPYDDPSHGRQSPLADSSVISRPSAFMLFGYHLLFKLFDKLFSKSLGCNL